MIAIVGGGITGLVLGWELAKRGVEYVVLEATERAGGVIRSATVDGRVLDWGPQRVRLTRAMDALIAELSLDADVLRAPSGLGLFVYRAGRLRRVPFSAAAFIMSDIVGPAAKLRLVAEPFTRAADPGERVSAFFTRKVGAELYDGLVAPLYGGLYGSDPAEMEVQLSVGHMLREFRVGRSLVWALLKSGGAIMPPAAASFRNGMQALPDALAARQQGHVKFGAAVSRIEAARAGWRVITAGSAIDARAVVLTVPSSISAQLLGKVAPHTTAAIAQLRYNPLAVVHLDADSDPACMGFQVALTEASLALRGVTFNESLFGRRRLHTAYLGGSRHPGIVELPDDAIAARAIAEFRQCTGRDARALAVARESMPAWDLTWRSITGLSLPPGLHVAANWHSRPGLPGRLADASRMARILTGEVPADG